MANKQTKCTSCKRVIDAQIAAANGGCCESCARISEKLRRQRREFEDSVASGAVFVPGTDDKQSARTFDQLAKGTVEWKLEPDYYRNETDQSVLAVIDAAELKTDGHVFLVSNDARLNLSFNGLHGVCEFQNQESGDYFYAWTPQNMAAQVEAGQQVEQACPCCGVGMLWFPSRFHMPRHSAFQLFQSIGLGRKIPSSMKVQWLDCGDISYTSPGRG